MRLWLALAAATAALALPAAAAADAVTAPVETWVPDGEVKALAVSGSTAYIGGNFSRIGPYTGSSALFDSATGDVRKPWPEVDGLVNAIASDGSGGWYLGGDFRAVAGVPRTDLAHVLPDRTLDPSFAPSTNGSVRALAVSGDTVFAGGLFTTANGIGRGHLAGFSRADGTLTGFVGGVDFAGTGTLFDEIGVYALQLVGSILYVGGEFNRATNVATLMGRYHGAAFDVTNSQIQAWNPSTNRVINGLGRDTDGVELFIGGRFNRVGVDAGNPGSTGIVRNNVAKVNESTGAANPNWVAPLLLSDLTTLMVFGQWVYLGGTVNVGPGQTWPVAAYNTADNNAGINNNWQPQPSGTVRSLAAAGSTVYIGSGGVFGGGSENHLIGVNATSFASTDTPSFAPALGRGREALPSGLSVGVRAIGANGSDVVAGGTFMNAGGVDRRNLAAIDLTTGRPTGFEAPMKGSFSPLTSVNALALTSDGLVWAGGDFATEAPDPRTSLAAFDAATGAIASFHRDPNGTVRALAASGQTVYAGGSFSTAGGSPRRNAAAFQAVPGENGTVLSFDPDVNGPVEALALAGDTLYMGGAFTELNTGLAALTANRQFLAAVDPSTGLATPWDPSPNDEVLALAVSGSRVIAGGEFTAVNGSVPRGQLAEFDAQTGTASPWAPVANSFVHALALDGATVFAGGEFTTVNGAPRASLAALDAGSGASMPLPSELSPEERNGPPSPGVARVGALFASQQTGLLAGGTYLMNTPALRTANLSLLGLPPIPPGGGADDTDPVLAMTASRRRFAVGRRATPINGTATATGKRRRRAPRGTTLRLRLSEPAAVRIEVLRKGKGRRVRGKCVKPRRANRGRKRCTRLIRNGRLRRSAPAGRSKVAFSGRIRRRALKPGRYVLRATPTDAAGNVGVRRSVSITIVR